MITEYARLAIAAAAVIVAIAVVAINQLQLNDDVVKLTTDSFVVAKHIEIINGTCPKIKAGPFESDECIRQVGEYYVTYLPPKTVVKIRDGWVIGFYQKVE
ncbi:MAG: hypothetical protein ACO2PN_11685 [Pyrobaculum sp.]|jgi:hypothetical protein